MERQSERATRLLGPIEALLRATDIRLDTIDQVQYDRSVIATRTHLKELFSQQREQRVGQRQ